MDARPREKYDKEFKRSIIALADQGDRSDHVIEQVLGLYDGALRAWRREVAKHSDEAFPCNGKRTARDEELYRLRLENDILRHECDVLNKSGDHLSASRDDRFRFMKKNRDEFHIERMVAVLEVSRSGYYAWHRRGEHSKRSRNSAFDAQVLEEFERSKSMSGTGR